MSESYCPRLSEASILLPLLRAHLAAAPSRHSLPGALAVDLLPIVDDRLFGYDLVPDRETPSHLTLGCNAKGEPVLRMKSYGAETPNGLRLAAVNGRTIARKAPDLRQIRWRDARFPDWPSAAASAWTQLALLLPEGPRQRVEVNEGGHRFLDEALRIAHAHLATWDPFIRFFGLPDEAQHGFALHGTAGEHGTLVAQRPDIWILRWKSPPHAIYEEWSVVPPDRDAATGLTRA